MMSDDLVKRLRQPWDVEKSIVSQTRHWMVERDEAADRIEELEAKLAKAAEGLTKISLAERHSGTKSVDLGREARAALARITDGEGFK